MTAALPNALTATRLLAVPVLVWLVLVDAGADGPARWWALVVFLLAAATDFLDGYLARRWSVVSSFGKIADPIADKALILTALALLVAVDDVPWWPLAVLAIREIWVTAGRLAVVSDTVIAASQGGKLKTMAQLAAVAFYLYPGGPLWLDAVAWWCLMGAVALAVISGVDYGLKIRRAARRQRARTHNAETEHTDVGAAP